MVIAAVPSVEMVRMVNSGTEAAMSAIRLARAIPGATWSSSSTAATTAMPTPCWWRRAPGRNAGIPAAPVSHVYGPAHALPALQRQRVLSAGDGPARDRVACVIVEPVAGNMGLVAPVQGFLQTLRKLTAQHGALLIFDEVMTGFRVAYGGAQRLYRIRPDLSCFGKIIGGGLPVALTAAGARSCPASPPGPIYQAGTLSGNPLAMAAGIATLKQLQKKGFYEKLRPKAPGSATASPPRPLGPAWRCRSTTWDRCSACSSAPIRCEVSRTPKMRPGTLCEILPGHAAGGRLYRPSQFEALFLSSAHTVEQIDATVRAAEKVLRRLRS